MANEIILNHGVAGRNLYAIIRNAARDVYKTTLFDFAVYLDGDWANYDIALTEQGTSGVYCVNWPGAIIRGSYNIEIRHRTTGSPLVTDKIVGCGNYDWNGDKLQLLVDLDSIFITPMTGAVGNNFATYWHNDDVVNGQTLDLLFTDIGFVKNDTVEIITRLPTVLIGGRMDSIMSTSATGAISRLSFTADSGLQSIHSASVGAYSGTSITLSGLASSINGFYNNTFIYITSGTGVGQIRTIIDYVGSTRVATLDSAFVTAPVAGSIYTILCRSFTSGDFMSSFSSEYGDEMARLDVAVSTRSVAGDAMTLTPTERGFTADKFLNRNLGGGSDGGTRTVKNALRSNRNKVEFDVPVFGQFTVYEEDDTTPAWTGTYTRGPNNLGPLVSTDPS